MLKNFDISKKNCTFALNFRYTISMQVPDKVNKAAQSLIKEYGGSVKYLGKYQDKDAFSFSADDIDSDVVYAFLWDGKNVDTLSGMLAVDIVSSLVED